MVKSVKQLDQEMRNQIWFQHTIKRDSHSSFNDEQINIVTLYILYLSQKNGRDLYVVNIIKSSYIEEKNIRSHCPPNSKRYIQQKGVGVI